MAKDFLSIVKNAKTTYEFSNKKVKNSDLKKILEAGRWAPSSHNCQNWHFVIIKNKETISKLLDMCYYGLYHTAPPLMIALVMKPVHSEMKGLIKGSIREYAGYHAYLNMGAVTSYLVLQASALGIDSFIGSPPIKETNALLNVHRDNKTVLVLGLGYEKKGAFKKPRTRKELKKLVSKEFYGGKQ